MTRFHAVLRGAFYLYFSLAAGLFAAGAVSFALLRTGPGRPDLPGNAGAAWLIAAAFIAMMLFFGQWEQFGRPVRLLRWLPLCGVITFLGVVGFALGAVWD
jgi:hypothetical protein